MTFQKYSTLLIVLFALTGHHAVARADRYQVDYPERQKSLQIVKVEGNWEFALTANPGRFASVYVNGSRVWKSNPMMEYFAMDPELTRIDMDGKGALDAILMSFRPHAGCLDFGAIISVEGGKENYLIHVSKKGEDVKNGGPGIAVEASHRLPGLISENFVKFVNKKCAWRPNPGQEAEFEKIMESGLYPALADNESAYAILLEKHAKFTSLISQHKSKEAIAILKEYFNRFDYRKIDQQGKIPQYTDILFEYGRELISANKKQEAIYILNRVLERDPKRTDAYLLLADAEHNYYDPEDPRTYEILPNVSTALPGGGTDESLNRRVRGLPEAVAHYKAYYNLMLAAGKKDKIPARVLERIQ